VTLGVGVALGVADAVAVGVEVGDGVGGQPASEFPTAAISALTQTVPA
jgi:hypothetical protein